MPAHVNGQTRFQQLCGSYGQPLPADAAASYGPIPVYDDRSRDTHNHKESAPPTKPATVDHFHLTQLSRSECTPPPVPAAVWPVSPNTHHYSQEPPAAQQTRQPYYTAQLSPRCSSSQLTYSYDPFRWSTSPHNRGGAATPGGSCPLYSSDGDSRHLQTTRPDRANERTPPATSTAPQQQQDSFKSGLSIRELVG